MGTMAVLASLLRFLITRIMNDSPEWDYAMVAVTSFDAKFSPVFEILNIYEVLNSLMYVLFVVSADSLIFVMMAHLSIHFKILQNAMR